MAAQSDSHSATSTHQLCLEKIGEHVSELGRWLPVILFLVGQILQESITGRRGLEGVSYKYFHQDMELTFFPWNYGKSFQRCPSFHLDSPFALSSLNKTKV